ncbi:MAG: serine/threonine-protein kinase [Myxococcota bacterium]
MVLPSQPPPHALAPGTIVDGRYRVSQLLRSSGEVAIYSATHMDLGRNVALTIYLGDKPRPAKRFIRSGRIVSMMRHPNVVQVFDLARIDGRPMLVLEDLDGPSLAERSAVQGPLRVDEVQPIAEQLLEALAYVHGRGVVHRDVAAENLHHLTAHDGSLLLKLTEFGFSKELGGAHYTSQTETRVIISGLTHVAPEQIMTPDAIDHRVDIYAAGAVLYRLLAGAPPFEAKNLSQLGTAILEQAPPSLTTLVDHVPAAVDEVIAQALAKNPDERFAGAEAMHRALAQAFAAG